MMTKKVALKGVLLAFVAFLLAFAYTGTASAYDLYELNNKTLNGDFSIDSNSDGKADSWAFGLGTSQIINGVQRSYGTATGNTYTTIQQTLSVPFIGGHMYYIAFTMKTNGTGAMNRLVQLWMTGHSQALWNTGADPNTYEAVITANYSYVNFETHIFCGNSTSYYQTLDNVIIIDLTLQWGSGLEPSLSDLQTLYLPADLDYFDSYQSFDAGSYTQLNISSYTDLVADLTGIDYKKSVIDTYGENIDVSIYAYFFDTASNDGDDVAQYYYTLNNPVVSWRSTTYELDWSFSDYSDRVLFLDLDDDQETILKRALFDRSIGGDFDADFTNDEGYLKLDVEGTAIDNVKFYVVFSSVFDLRVDVQSFLISYDTDFHENEFTIAQELYIKCQDKYDQTLLPALFIPLGDYGTKVIDDFGSAFTDVLSFNIEFEFVSPEPTDDSLVQTIYLYELGAFSSSDVVIGNYDPTLPLPFDPQVCDWYEMGCQAKNGINDFVAWFYDKFDIEAISASVSDIFDSFDQVISLMPDEIVVILSIVASAMVAILIIVIVDRITGGRSG